MRIRTLDGPPLLGEIAAQTARALQLVKVLDDDARVCPSSKSVQTANSRQTPHDASPTPTRATTPPPATGPNRTPPTPRPTTAVTTHDDPESARDKRICPGAASCRDTERGLASVAPAQSPDVVRGDEVDSAVACRARASACRAAGHPAGDPRIELRCAPHREKHFFLVHLAPGESASPVTAVSTAGVARSGHGSEHFSHPHSLRSR